MGNCCQEGNKDSYKKTSYSQLFQKISQNSGKKQSISNSLFFSDSLITIQSRSLTNITADTMIVFVDKPFSILNNSFVRNLEFQEVSNFKKKIKDILLMQKSEKQLYVKVEYPFDKINIGRLIIFQLKVWDIGLKQSRYLKKTIQNGIKRCCNKSRKTKLAILDIQPCLGYNEKEFYNIVRLNVRQMKQFFDLVTYVTNREINIESDEEADENLRILNTEVSEKSSNYY